MCQWGTYEEVLVKILPAYSCTGKEHWKMAKIDACIAPIVRALQEGGIDMVGSCCGHYEREGYIELADGRCLVILPADIAQQWLACMDKSRSLVQLINAQCKNTQKGESDDGNISEA